MHNKRKIELVINLIIFIILLSLIFFSNLKVGNKGYIKSAFQKLSAPFQYILKNEEFKKNKLKLTEYESLDEIIEENKKLKKQLEEEKINNRLSDEIVKENTRLSEIINLKDQYSTYKTQPAEIIYTIDKDFEKSVIINVGKNKNIKENMIILSANGLFGKVIEVYDDTSKVQKITDPTSNVSVNIVGDNNTFVVRGSADSNLLLTMIESDTNITNNKDLYTAGGSNIYPAGIYVGKISRMVYEKNPFDSYALLEKRPDLEKASRVLVLKGAINE